MKKILLFFLAVLAFTSCSDDVTMDVVVDDCVPCQVSVDLAPETRAAAESLDSLLGSSYELRYVLEIYEGTTRRGGQQVAYSSDLSVVFAVKLPPTRTYHFVVWADIVKPTDANPTPESTYYNTDSLTRVSFKDWANSDLRDAFAGVVEVRDYSSSSSINLKLKRPFAKLRIVDTGGIQTADAKTMTVQLTPTFPNTFNVLSGTATSVNSLQSYPVKLGNLDHNVSGKQTLFTDFIFAGDTDTSINISVDFYDSGKNAIGTTKTFTVDVACNKLTTIEGNII